MNGDTVGRTDLELNLSPGGVIVSAGPIAVYNGLVATTGNYGSDSRQAQYGQILSGAPGVTLTNTGVYPKNETTTDSFLDGTTDGTYNYMIGANSSAQGTIYRCGLDWSNPTPVASMGQPIDFTGITYDPVSQSLWVIGRGSVFFSMFEVTLPSSPGRVNYLQSFAFVGSTAADALAMDVDRTLWMADLNNQGTLLHYDRSGNYLGSYTPADTFVRPLGGEIALPEPASFALLLISITQLSQRRRNLRREE
ncbi:MAG: hypothetical protein QM754_08565 [Tepidisphaeraceae bacterium]